MTLARLTMGVLLGIALSHVQASAQSRGELLYTTHCIALPAIPPMSIGAKAGWPRTGTASSVPSW